MNRKFLISNSLPNNYLLEKGTNVFHFLHPNLVRFFNIYNEYKQDISLSEEEILIKITNVLSEDESCNDFKYYIEKFKHILTFINKRGFIEIEKHHKITAHEIELALANSNFILLEVTEKCNLQCKYCGYGSLYNDSGRQNRSLKFNKTKKVLNQLINLWNSDLTASSNGYHKIDFYGGEPLLNIDYIKKVVEYLNKQDVKHRTFAFAMTTNAVLLDKHIDFFVKNEFRLLISLDGNIINNKFRVTKKNVESYNIVYKNVKLLKQKHPEYFDKYVSFNAVYNISSNEDEIRTFFKTEFNKPVTISGLATNNLNDDNINLFNSIYKKYDSSKDSQDKLKENYISSDITNFVKLNWGREMTNYTELRVNNKRYYHTGTCIPFRDKIMITANNELLLCEREGGKQHIVGKHNEDGFVIDYENAAAIYNNYFDKIITKYCKNCYEQSSCKVCIFKIENIENDNFICPDFLSKQNFLEKNCRLIKVIQENPSVIKEISNDIINRANEKL